VSRSGYYKHKKAMKKVKESTHQTDVINCFHKNKGAYGRIRIRKYLLKKGIQVSEYKISRILSENGLVSKYGRPRKRKHPLKTKSEYASENLVKEKFKINKKNTLWCADITELKGYRGQKIYVSGIIDVGVRRIVGWSIATHSRQEIVHEAIKMAYGRCRPEKGLIFHCDRGCQYTSNETKKIIDEFNMISSMSRPGSPTDNQPIESFWKTMKIEMDDISHMKFEEAKRTIIKYIECFYNSERLHTSLAYKTPNEVWNEQSYYKN
jgi:putative transposase